MINTKQTIENMEIAKQYGFVVAEGPIRALCDEIDRLSAICEQMQFGAICDECGGTGVNYDSERRELTCGDCDFGGK